MRRIGGDSIIPIPDQLLRCNNAREPVSLFVVGFVGLVALRIRDAGNANFILDWSFIRRACGPHGLQWIGLGLPVVIGDATVAGRVAITNGQLEVAFLAETRGKEGLVGVYVVQLDTIIGHARKAQ